MPSLRGSLNALCCGTSFALCFILLNGLGPPFVAVCTFLPLLIVVVDRALVCPPPCLKLGCELVDQIRDASRTPLTLPVAFFITYFVMTPPAQRRNLLCSLYPVD